MTKFDETKFGGEDTKQDTNGEMNNNKQVEQKKVTQDEINAVALVPSLYSNKFYLTMLEGMAVKITFGEDNNSNVPCMRGSYVMTINKFMELAQFVSGAASSIQQQMKQADHFKKLADANANKARDREELN